jgi:acetyl esterase/lipase
MAPVPVPTLGDKLALVGNVPRVLAAAIGALLFRPFTSGAVPNTAFKHFAFTAVRTNLDLITDAQEEWTKTPTEAAYKAYAKTARFDPSTDLLSSGLKVHWLGDKNAKKVVLYFHGGGYALAATAGHVQWLAELQKELGPQVAVLLVEYTLTPREQYPVQLKQGAEALEWLLTTKDINPSNVST